MIDLQMIVENAPRVLASSAIAGAVFYSIHCAVESKITKQPFVDVLKKGGPALGYGIGCVLGQYGYLFLK
jgi:hypothetical protein